MKVRHARFPPPGDHATWCGRLARPEDIADAGRFAALAVHERRPGEKLCPDCARRLREVLEDLCQG